MIEQIMVLMEGYLAGDISWQEMEGWFANNIDELMDEGDWEGLVLADQVDADLMEVSKGVLTEEEFRIRVQARMDALTKEREGGT
ncbi:MAG: hypothetical protein HY532_05645 [Chloroflexi bacterium]|nr:hypothetical protein [Chloroflexota bacterium]